MEELSGSLDENLIVYLLQIADGTYLKDVTSPSERRKAYALLLFRFTSSSFCTGPIVDIIQNLWLDIVVNDRVPSNLSLKIQTILKHIIALPRHHA